MLNTVYKFNFAQICQVFYFGHCVYNLLIYCYIQRKGVSPDTPSHIIQKHYEFYLANKIKSYRYVNYSQLDIFCLLFLLRHFESALFAFAIAFALSANVVAEHGSEYEILFWAKLV